MLPQPTSLLDASTTLNRVSTWWHIWRSLSFQGSCPIYSRW